MVWSSHVKKKKLPEHSRKLFSLDSFKSRHPVLEFSNHHQRNLQSEHTASQFNPAHLLTLAPAEPALRPALCVCACPCVLLCGPVCVLLPFETRVTRHWSLTRAEPKPCEVEGTAHKHMFPSCACRARRHAHFHTVSFVRRHEP